MLGLQIGAMGGLWASDVDTAAVITARELPLRAVFTCPPYGLRGPCLPVHSTGCGGRVYLSALLAARAVFTCPPYGLRAVFILPPYGLQGPGLPFHPTGCGGRVYLSTLRASGAVFTLPPYGLRGSCLPVWSHATTRMVASCMASVSCCMCYTAPVLPNGRMLHGISQLLHVLHCASPA